MIFYDLLYLTYLVPAERVQAWLPGGLSPATVGDDQAVLSVWLFHVLEAKAARLPSPRVAYNQMTVHTFVHDPHGGDKALYLLKAGVTLPLVRRVGRFFGMPVEPIRLDIRPERDKRLRYHHYRAEGEWDGALRVEADEVAPRLEALPPFANAQEAVIFLTDMLVGLYSNGRRLYRLEAWHPRLQPRVARVQTVRLPILSRLGFLGEEEIAHPHAALLAPRGHYLLHLPPQRLNGGS